MTTVFGACREHPATQTLLNANGLLPKIRSLCKSTIPRIANLAERIQETILTGPTCDAATRAALETLLSTEDTERKARAEAHRQSMLARMAAPVVMP